MRRAFDRAWPTIEAIGLRLTGLVIALIGLALVIRSANIPDAEAVAYDRAALFVGAAFVLVGALAADRSRDDLAQWTLTGTAGVFAALFLLSGDPDFDRDAAVNWLLYIGILLFALKVFGGAFRKRRSSAPPRPVATDEVDARRVV